MYANTTPTISSGKAVRICVAPVAITSAGLTFGALVASVETSRLTNPAWAAAMANAPPMVWKTRKWLAYHPKI